MAGNGDAGGDRLKAFTAAVGGLTAVVAAVVLLGGIVVGFRLRIYNLPWEVVLSQLGQGFLLATGLAEVIGPLVAVFVLYALVEAGLEQVTGRWASKGNQAGKNFPTSSLWRAPFVGFAWTWNKEQWGYKEWVRIFLWLVVGLLAVWGGRVYFGLTVNQTFMVWSGLLTLLGAGVAIAFLTTLGGLLHDLRDQRHLRVEACLFIVSAVVAFVGFLPLACVNAIALPLPYAIVCPTDTQTMADGWFIGETTDKVILGTIGSANSSGRSNPLVLVPSRDARIIETDKPSDTQPAACPPAG